MPKKKPITLQPQPATLPDPYRRVQYFRGEYVRAVCLEYPHLMEPLRKLTNHWVANEAPPEDLLENWARNLHLPSDRASGDLGIEIAMNVQDILEKGPSDVWKTIARERISHPIGTSFDNTTLKYIPDDQWDWVQDEREAERIPLYQIDQDGVSVPPPVYNPIVHTKEDYEHKIDKYMRFQEALYARVYGVKPLPKKSAMALHAKWTVWHRIGRKSFREIAEPGIQSSGQEYEKKSRVYQSVAEAVKKFTLEIDTPPRNLGWEIEAEVYIQLQEQIASNS
jgi:hypothetical protein